MYVLMVHVIIEIIASRLIRIVFIACPKILLNAVIVLMDMNLMITEFAFVEVMLLLVLITRRVFMDNV